MCVYARARAHVRECVRVYTFAQISLAVYNSCMFLMFLLQEKSGMSVSKSIHILFFYHIFVIFEK